MGVPVKPYLCDSDFQLFNGDAREVLAELPDESVHMCCTSPPFFGLRDYGMDGQIGLEATPEEWVAQLVAVFEEVRRVLRKDGTLWVECGDSYNAYNGNRGETGSTLEGRRQHLVNRPEPSRGLTTAAAKPKDLIGQPFLLAFALREAGWYWRNVCIWHKPNPMPESVRDRFTVSHSYVLLFSKSPRYFFDQEAVREPYLPSSIEREKYGHNNAYGSQFAGSPSDTRSGKRLEPGEINTLARGPDGRRQTAVKAGDNSIQHRDGERWPNSGRNARSVWTIPTEPLKHEHYAAFPSKLVERCIKAGTSERGCCPECGAPWVRIVEVESSWRSRAENGATRGNLAPEGLVGAGTQRAVHGSAGVSHDLDSRRREVLGWQASCECNAGEPVPASVLDCFGGSGTTGLVSRRLGRHAILIELNEKYCQLTAERTSQLSLIADTASATAPEDSSLAGQA